MVLNIGDNFKLIINGKPIEISAKADISLSLGKLDLSEKMRKHVRESVDLMVYRGTDTYAIAEAMYLRGMQWVVNIDGVKSEDVKNA